MVVKKQGTNPIVEKILISGAIRERGLFKQGIDPDIYSSIASDAPKGSRNGKQNTWFVYKEGLTIQP